MNKLSNPLLCFYKPFQLNSSAVSWLKLYILNCCALHCKFICNARLSLIQASVLMSLYAMQNLQYKVDPLGAACPCVTTGSERVLELLVSCTVQTTQSSSQLDSNWLAGGPTELLALVQSVLSQNECRLTWADTPPKSTSSTHRQINNNVPSKSHIAHGHMEPEERLGPRSEVIWLQSRTQSC